jgi:DNA-binding NtrC family response regulator
LNVYPIRVPALRERADDIEPLANYLLQIFAARHDKRVAGFSDLALDAMRCYPWPGNVRELENLIERGVILVGQGYAIDAPLLFPALPGSPASTVSAKGSLEQEDPGVLASMLDMALRHGLGLQAMEDGLIEESVRRCNGNLAAAARELGLTRPQLAYRLQRLQADGRKVER